MAKWPNGPRLSMADGSVFASGRPGRRDVGVGYGGVLSVLSDLSRDSPSHRCLNTKA